MRVNYLIWLLFTAGCFTAANIHAQTQTCPANINFASGSLDNWFAYTGTFLQNTDRAIANRQDYDAATAYPLGALGAKSLPEYALPSSMGIQVLTSASFDAFGGFSTIPTINGYSYNYSVLIGSTNINSTPGGYFRGVGYKVTVPDGTGPYTMTYAYAMVLENGSHASIQQPLASATIYTDDGIIACASPKYFLPTNNGILDVATATRNGFKLSAVPTPNTVRTGETPYRVWYKDWTEVTFDLQAYRGKTVNVVFTGENCVPRGHFAYAYFAIRNECSGLKISGYPVACMNTPTTYSVPALESATYTWTVPPGWQILSDSTSNIITVMPGTQPGQITVREVNSCADLTSIISVSASAATMPGAISGDTTVCEGINSSTIQLTGNVGSVAKWISSIDGTNWTDINNTSSTYIAKNLSTTTQFKAVIQNGPTCKADSTQTVVVTVNTFSKGGELNPSFFQICQDQNKDATLKLQNFNGSVVNWQYSYDSIVWKNFSPVRTDSTYDITGTTVATKFRVIVQNGVCAADTGKVATVNIFSERFPRANISPIDTTICFGTAANLSAIITIGTQYTWSNTISMLNPGNGIISGLPFGIDTKVAPSRTTQYVIDIKNGNCPNLLKDTFNIRVLPALTAFAGRDTFVTANQPLQLTGQNNLNDSSITIYYQWSPALDLNNPNISNPVATLPSSIDSIVYRLTVSTTEGCYAQDDIKVTVFKNDPDIYVPSAFTPNKDGLNDIFKPIPVGLTKLNYFNIYNRWGQMIYSTKEIGKGWDGYVNGVKQAPGTYVYIVEGVDYKGKTIFRKGTFVLIE